ncbi:MULTISPECIES: LUD domain-containing protein [unclassified Algibacter]|uniref:LutC/YkgG family protein n=1 Tax=unclassified Algibacter TaxID=2615009 RepID=UPI00131E8519|nr:MULTISPECIES: LUD domain-containing protein [unclassified Algibacter]MCL5129624.1 LUD domain-containing protein [Algibacter sp. L4_22]
MSSRDQILSKISANKPELLHLPDIDMSIFDEGLDLIKEFTKKIEVVGGNVIKTISNDAVISQMETLFPDAKVKYSTLVNTESFNTLDLTTIKNSQDLEDLDILILESDLAVAENGAVWVSDKQLPMRALPFITKHLVVIVSKESIVPYMHQAYAKLSETSNDFGVFIAGPSKTADIEQSLVIGAQGALSFTLFLK